MKTPKAVDCLWLEATCCTINLAQWKRWMDGATRADHHQIDNLVRRHLPDLYEALSLNLRNPYHYYKTRRHLILVHSAIEHFLRYGPADADSKSVEHERRPSMAGEYRMEDVLKQLPEDIAGAIRDGSLRIALAAQPMSGVVPRPDLSERLAAVYGAIAGMGKYVRGLSDGSMVPVVVPEDAGCGKVWRPGELFFKS